MVCNTVIERLQKEQDEENEMLKLLGFECAARWLQFDGGAKPSELRRLQLLRDQCTSDGDWETQFITRDDDVYSAAECLAFWVCPRQDGNRYFAAEFWKARAGSSHGIEHNEPAFLRHFVEHALEYWGEAKDQIKR